MDVRVERLREPAQRGWADIRTRNHQKRLGRPFWNITITGQGPEGPFMGAGVITYQERSPASPIRGTNSREAWPVLKTGNLGCDLGGTCNLHFETPPFEHNGARIQLRGRYYLTSPFAYRVTTKISLIAAITGTWEPPGYTKTKSQTRCHQVKETRGFHDPATVSVLHNADAGCMRVRCGS